MENLKGTFISGVNGELIEVTNIKEALSQAKSAINFNETLLRERKVNPDTIIFPQALKEWKFILIQLEKLEMKLKAKKKIK